MTDKFVAIGAVFFVLADAFAISAVVSPWWITFKPLDGSGGMNRYGLTVSCRQIPDSSDSNEQCGWVEVPYQWKITLVFLIMGIGALTAALGFLFASFARRSQSLENAQKIAFFGMVSFCLAALIFPTGFGFEEIGGAAYLLTSTANVGTSYVLFIMALFFTIIGELFAARICAPMI
ncbi:modulator of smoothened protein-like [Oscarella lobularis]|uniref:modulator of smoothened protein-like n=1 Tax=Oscarella lobularis TaxID=121494 RepID=UPI0033139C29